MSEMPEEVVDDKDYELDSTMISAQYSTHLTKQTVWTFPPPKGT